MKKIFIDGREGTTGLSLETRLKSRDDIEFIVIDEKFRKDAAARNDCINAADFVFLCLPDAAASEAAAMAENPATRIIDASTAHRTQKGWAYGFPELSKEHRANIERGNRVSVPGCHASGFLAIVYPLIAEGIIGADYPVCANSITGYSGGGKSMIADYEQSKTELLASPRQYGLSQMHKHLKEMQFVARLEYAPLFQPFVSDFYRGMQVSLPITARLMKKQTGMQGLFDFYSEYYCGQPLINIEFMKEAFMPSNLLADKDNMTVFVGGNDERIVVSALFDNLGKGAGGAAVQCFNIMSGEKETKGLNI